MIIGENFIFAGTIYKMHDQILPILKSLGVINEDVVKRGDLLQVLGEWGRVNIDPEVWCMTCRSEVDTFLKAGDVAVVSDTRMKNEFHYFPEALRVSLDAPEYIRKARCPAWRENTHHPSEVGLDYYHDMGYFDMYFETEHTPAEVIAKSIVERLKTQDWVSNRNRDCVDLDVSYWNNQKKHPTFINDWTKGETLYEARVQVLQG